MSIDILQDKIRKMKNPSMLGLDPSQEVVPEFLQEEAFEKHGKTPEGLADAYRTFCLTLLDTLKDTIPAVKLQLACFESLGAPGIAVLQELSAEAASRGYYVAIDSTRGDPPHIAELWAASLFGGLKIGGESCAPYTCDAVTLSGYLGTDSIRPFLPYCRENGKNIFLLVKTSNRSGREVQDLISGDRVVHTAMADLALRWGGDVFGRYGYSEVGAVMAATYPQALASMRQKYDRLFFLVAGYGAQGGTAKNAACAFDQLGHGAVVTASRSLIGAWRREEGNDGRDYAQRALDAAVKMKHDLSKYVTVI